jgi:hypothetical protein
MKDDTVLIISNYGLGDVTFDSDIGSWNVSRAIRDCKAGKHKLYQFEVAEALANNENIDVDHEQIDKMVQDILSEPGFKEFPPLIFCQENGLIYLIDGHHRLRVLARLRIKEFSAYVIEEKDSAPYRIYWNGDRISPWIKLDAKEKTNA